MKKMKLTNTKLIKTVALVVIVAALCAGGYAVRLRTADFQHQPTYRDVNGFIEIKDLGVKIKRTEAMKGWTFASEPGYQGAVYVRTPDYTAEAKACQKIVTTKLTDKQLLADTAAMTLYRQDSVYDTKNGPRFDRLAKQFDGFYVAFSSFGSNVSCKGTPQEADMKRIADDTFKTLEDVFKQAESIKYTGPKLPAPSAKK